MFRRQYANSGAERLAVTLVKCRPAFGTHTANACAVLLSRFCKKRCSTLLYLFAFTCLNKFVLVALLEAVLPVQRGFLGSSEVSLLL